MTAGVSAEAQVAAVLVVGALPQPPAVAVPRAWGAAKQVSRRRPPVPIGLDLCPQPFWSRHYVRHCRRP